MFRVRPSRINGMRGMISSFASEKRHIVRTLSKRHRVDYRPTYMRVTTNGMSVVKLANCSDGGCDMGFRFAFALSRLRG